MTFKENSRMRIRELGLGFFIGNVALDVDYLRKLVLLNLEL